MLLIFDVSQACAPLYHWRTLKSTPEKDPVGTCYVAIQNFSAYAEYSPCRNSKLFLFLETEISLKSFAVVDSAGNVKMPMGNETGVKITTVLQDALL